MTYLGQTKIAINNVKTLKLFTVTKLKIRHFSHFYNKCTANSDGRGLFGQKGDQKGTKSCINWQKSPLRGKSPLKGTQFSTLSSSKDKNRSILLGETLERVLKLHELCQKINCQKQGRKLKLHPLLLILLLDLIKLRKNTKNTIQHIFFIYIVKKTVAKSTCRQRRKQSVQF